MTAQLRSTLLQVRKEKRRADDLLHVVIPIGVDLSSEKDFNRLLEKILVEAKAFCHAQAGILYLLRKEEQQLEYVIVRNDARHVALGGTTGNKVPFDPLPLYKTGAQEAASRHVAVQAAISGDPINIADAYIEADDLESEWYDFSGPQELELNGQAGDETPARHATSWLAIPLANNREEVIGIIQLMNARDADSGQVIAFDPNLQQMMESFSSLAVAALEAYMREEGLRQEIQKLRIEIDEVKRQEHVQQIVDSDFFQDLRARADSLRQRVRGPRNRPSSEDEDQPEEDTSSETDS
jgi:GAF domain-containing protein